MTSKYQIVLLCESYDEVPSCLDIIEQALLSKSRFLVIVFVNKDLYELFSCMKERLGWDATLKFVGKYKRPKKKVGHLKWLYNLFISIFEERNHYHSFVKQNSSDIRYAQVFFFTRYINAPTQLYIKYLPKSNSVILRQVLEFSDIKKIIIPRKLSEMLRIIRNKIIFGTGFVFARTPHRIMEYIPDRFLIRNVQTMISKNEENMLLHDFNYTNWDIWNKNQYSVVYFDQPLVQSGRVDASEFREDLIAIFDVVNKYFQPGEVAIKQHPGVYSDTSYLKYGTDIPRYISGEFLYNSNVKLYLSFSSGAITRIQNALVVSLIDLIRFKDKKVKEYIKQRLFERAQSNITCPQSIEQFEEIVRKAISV